VFPDSVDWELGWRLHLAANKPEEAEGLLPPRAKQVSGSEAGSYLRLIDSLYHSTLGLRVIKKIKRTGSSAGVFTWRRTNRGRRQGFFPQGRSRCRV